MACPGLDVVGKVVGKVAREGDTARDGLLLIGRPHLLDVVLVIGIDNGRDVEVRDVVPAIEGDLAEHARDVGLALPDCIPVSLPAMREGDGDVLVTRDHGVWDLGGVRVAGEVDGAVDGVLGHEGDRVLGGGHDGGGEEGDKLGELHVDGLRVYDTPVEVV